MQQLNRRFVFFFILLPSTRKPVQGPLPHVHCNDHLQSILVSPAVLLYALTHHIPLSTRVLVWSPECVVREVLQAGTLPSSLLCYGNEACWTHKSTERAALCFVSAYTIAKTVMLSILLPDRELLVDQLLCLVQAGQLRRQSPLTLAFHLSEQRDTHLVCLTVCQLIEVTFLSPFNCCGHHDAPFEMTFSSAAGASRCCSLSNKMWRLKCCVHAHDLHAGGIFTHCFLI